MKKRGCLKIELQKQKYYRLKLRNKKSPVSALVYSNDMAKSRRFLYYNL
jgi:hypothetical protein